MTIITPTQNWVFIGRRERGKGRGHPRDFPTMDWVFSLPVSISTCEGALDFARTECGLPGGSGRAGVFQVQGPLGVWDHITGNKIDFSTPGKAAKVIYKSWEQLEAEEVA